jgi:hypothetical protein
VITEDGMRISDIQYEEDVTPEQVRTVFVLIARSIVLREESIRTMRELEHTIAVKVGTEREVHMPRWERSRSEGAAHRCQRCGADFNDGYTHRVVEFDGRWWHKHNCQGKVG